MFYFVEDLVIATFEEFVDPTEIINHQGEHPTVVDNLDSEGESVLFFDEEHPYYNTDFNGEREASSNSKEEEEEGYEDMVDAYLDWMALGPLSLSENLHKMPKYLETLFSKFNLEKKMKKETILIIYKCIYECLRYVLTMLLVEYFCTL